MRPALELDVAGVVVETSLAPDDAARLGAQLERAFALLAERLRVLPASASEGLRDLVVEQLVIDLDQDHRALQPGGASLLADELLRQLLARTQV